MGRQLALQVTCLLKTQVRSPVKPLKNMHLYVQKLINIAHVFVLNRRKKILSIAHFSTCNPLCSLCTVLAAGRDTVAKERSITLNQNMLQKYCMFRRGMWAYVTPVLKKDRFIDRISVIPNFRRKLFKGRGQWLGLETVCEDRPLCHLWGRSVFG